jgi:hypothetical protein
VTHDVANLDGSWENLDDHSVLELGPGGDFTLTPAGDESFSGSELIGIVGTVSGKWAIDGGKLKLTVNLGSVKLSSSSWWMRFGLKMISFILRFFGEREILHEEVTRLTATDLWFESSQGIVSKFSKKLK